MVAAFITEPLVVDPVIHAAEIARFEAKITEGPGEYCRIWHGAIGDDGYGRYSITRGGRERTVKPHRYAVAHKLGVPVEFGEVIEHIVCDNSICCRAHLDTRVGHVWPPRKPTTCVGWRARGGVEVAAGGSDVGRVCPVRNAWNVHVRWPLLFRMVGTRRVSELS
jgi:hypothetical protein